MTIFAVVVSLLLGWKWGPLVGFALIAMLAVIVVVIEDETVAPVPT